MKTRAALMIAMLFCVGCTTYGRIGTIYPAAPTASENVDVRPPAGKLDAVLTFLRQTLSSNASENRGASISIDVRPDYQVPAAPIAVSTRRYVSALEDARAKAQAIAAEEGVQLGRVQSVQEVFNGSVPPFSALKGNIALPPSVHVLPNQPILLNVVYALNAGSGSDATPHIVAVYGMSSSSDVARPAAASAQQLISISINARGSTVQDAVAKVQSYESAIRTAVAHLGLQPSALQITHSSTWIQ